MSEKQIDAHLALRFMEASALLATLTVEFEDLRWKICFHDELYPSVYLSRKHCRELLEAISYISRRMVAIAEEEKEDASKVVAITDKRK